MLSLTRVAPPLLVCALLLIGVLRQAQAQSSLPAPAPAPAPAHAPASRMPSAADIEAARARLPKPGALEQAIKDQAGVVPRVPAAATNPALQPSPDLAELAAQYEAVRRGSKATGDDPQDRQAAGLLIFVSLGMPVASLERLLADAERAPAMLVLRGIQDRSMNKTTARMRALMGERRVAWQIDPQLFTRFEVTAVPTYVLIDPARPVLVACGQNQCQQPSFSKVVGDVTIGRAMAAVERDDAQFAVLARRYAKRVGGSQ